MEQVLVEVLARPFKPTEIRVLLQLHALTSGRGRADVAATIEQLARACHADRGHLGEILDKLIAATVVRRDDRAGTWSLHPVEDWGALPDGRIAAAVADIIAVDEQNRLPLDMWPEHSAAEWVSEIPTSEKPTRVGNSDTASLPAYARAQEPGNNLTRNNLEPGKSSGKGTGLSKEQWQLLNELVRWCSETGEACSISERKNWGWRIWTQPLVMTRALRAAVDHVNGGKKHRSRFGLVKSFWRRWSGDDNFPSLPLTRSADRLHVPAAAQSPTAGGVHTAAPSGDGAIHGPPPPPGHLRAAVLARIAETKRAEAST